MGQGRDIDAGETADGRARLSARSCHIPLSRESKPRAAGWPQFLQAALQPMLGDPALGPRKLSREGEAGPKLARRVRVAHTERSPGAAIGLPGARSCGQQESCKHDALEHRGGGVWGGCGSRGPM